MLPSPLAGPVAAGRLPPQNIEVLRLVYERAVRDMMASREWARTAVTCVEFIENKQWDPKDKQALEAEGRPALTFNKISPLFRLVSGYQQQNRYDIKYLPGSDALSTQDVADVLNHVAKQVTTANKLKWTESDVFRDGLGTGRGFMDVRLDFTKNLLGEISISDVDPFSVYPDAEAQSYGTDKWNHVTTARWMSLDDIYISYGKAGEKALSPYSQGGANMPSLAVGAPMEDDERPQTFFALAKFFDGFEGGIAIGTQQFGLMDFIDKTRKMFRVLDQQHYVLTRGKYLVNLDTGEKRDIPEEWDKDKIESVLAWAASPVDTEGQPKDTYNVAIMTPITRRVRWTTVAGDVILYDDWSPYRSFTIIPFFAYFRRGKTMGMVEDLIDAQREINKRRSAELHIVGTTANSGWMYHEEALDVEEQENLKDYGSAPGVHVKWKGSNKPERIQPAAPPMAMERLEKAATADLKEISGINESALGSIDRVQSGRAIEARQRQAVIAIQCYVDNFARSREMLGEKILEIVQDYYTEERIIRTQGDDGQDVTVKINHKDAADQILNNITVGSYMVAIDEVPMSATFLAGQFEEAMDMKEKGIPIPDDILVDLSSMPRKREIKQRLKDASQAPSPEMQKAQAEGQVKIAIAKIQAEANIEAAAMKAKFDGDIAAMELRLKAERGFFDPAPPAPPPGPDITVNHNQAAPEPAAPGAGGPAPGGPAAHAVIPGGGVPPAGAGMAPELPVFGA
jgi:hypothetical protein